MSVSTSRRRAGTDHTHRHRDNSDNTDEERFIFVMGAEDAEPQNNNGSR